MMKRFAAYSFILLATFLMLAHSMVPHHHHDNVLVTLVNPSSGGVRIENAHHGDMQTHKDKPAEEECNMDYAVVKKLSHDMSCVAWHTHDGHCGNHLYFCGLCAGIVFSDLFYSVLPCRAKPYFSGCLALPHLRVWGLRAPPIH